MSVVPHLPPDPVAALPRAGLRDWMNPWFLSQRRLREAMMARAPLVHGRLLDVGCGAKPYRDLFAVERYVGVDVEGATVDARASALALPFGDAAFDCVLTNEVLEHVPEPSRMMSEIARVLKPGGVLVLSAPMTWGLHHEPWDFYRYTPYGLRHLAESNGLVVESIEATSGFFVTFAQRFSDSLFETWGAKPKGPIARRVLRVVCAATMIQGAVLEKIFGKRGDALDHVMVARRPARKA